MTVSLERRTERSRIACDLRNPLLLGAQHITLLLDDLVDALVLAADLLEESREFRGILDALRRELSYAARRALDDEARHSLRIVDRGQHPSKVIWIAAKARHRQHYGGVRRRGAQVGKINRPRINELRHTLLRNSFDVRGFGRCGAFAQARRCTQGFLAVAQRRGGDQLRRPLIQRRDPSLQRGRGFLCFAE